MTKRNILLLSLASIVLAIIGVALLVPAATKVASNCTQDQINAGTCSTGLGAAGVISIFVLVLGGIAGTAAWILALIRSASMHSWVWFVIVLLISGLGTLAYAIFGPADRPKVPGYAQPGYPPNYQPNYPQNYPPTAQQQNYPPAPQQQSYPSTPQQQSYQPTPQQQGYQPTPQENYPPGPQQNYPPPAQQPNYPSAPPQQNYPPGQTPAPTG